MLLSVNEKMTRNYWREKSRGQDGESAVSSRSSIPPIEVSEVFDKIFGGSTIDIVPTGFVNLDFGGRFQRIDNLSPYPSTEKWWF